MAAQLTYGFQIPVGVPGGLYDISPYRIDSRLNAEEEDGRMMFGMGAVRGPEPEHNVLIPNAASTPALFEGVIMNGFTTEMNMGGEVVVKHLDTVGILAWGKAWVRVAEDVEPAYKDPLYLIINGDETGKFTNVATDAIRVRGRFVGGLGTGAVAPVEIYNEDNA